MNKQRLIRKWIKVILVHLMDGFFWLQKKRMPLPDAPKRILICNIASFGDVVIATTVLPVLKRHYPESEIGFLTSWNSSEVLKEHPLVARLHTIDHWYGNRERGVWRAVFRHIRDLRRAVKEIRECRYEVAIDLYPHFLLSVLPLLWRAKIPIRIGRFTQGYSNLLTHMAPPSSPSDYMGQSHLILLKILNIDVSQESPFPSYFPQDKPLQLPPKRYIAIHMGTAYSLKEWDTKKWSQVVKALVDQGEIVVLTGKGAREQIRCDEVALGTRCINYCNQLSWAEFTNVIQHAKLVISVDSAAVHLASAVQIPCIVLFAGINSISIWKPPYSKCRALRKAVPCAPCLISKGCSRMSCIQEIEVGEVLHYATQLGALQPRLVCVMSE